MSASFSYHVVVKLELYLMLAVSLNFLVGYTGLVSLCHGAFYGVGAYATALLMLRLGWDVLPALAATVLLTMACGALVALPSLRLRGDYFVVATLAFQTIVYRFLYNADELTRGALGLMDIPEARLGGLLLGREGPALAVAGALLVTVVVGAIGQLIRSPFGRCLRALRDDELALAALGRNTAALKVKAFLVGSAGAALAGTLLAAWSDVLHPNEFTIEQSVLVLTAVVVGGSGTQAGPLLGATLLVVLEEVLRYLGGEFTSFAGELNAILLALLLMLVLRLRPQGLAGAARD